MAFVIKNILPLADHSQKSIIDDRHLNRQPFLDDSGKLIHCHLEPAITGDNPDFFFGIAKLSAYCSRQSVAQGAVARAGIEIAAGLPRFVEEIGAIDRLGGIARDDDAWKRPLDL